MLTPISEHTNKGNSITWRNLLLEKKLKSQPNLELMKNLKITLLFTLLTAFAGMQAQTWQLQWADEFDYTGSPDAASWNMENWTPGWVNDENQARL